jgi:tRNA (mo5U34)-methyltransferase
MEMTEETIRAELERLAPFHHEVELPYGLTTTPPELTRRPGQQQRMSDMMNHAWPALLDACGGSLAGKRVLDVGCNAGGFAFKAAEDGADYVLGIDPVDRYIEQANFIGKAIGAEDVEFAQLSIEELDPEVHGIFDVVLNFGLLYHLENPVMGMRKIADVTGRLMIVDTNVDPDVDGPYWQLNVANQVSLDSKSASTSLWRSEAAQAQFLPSPEGVEVLLEFLGFEEVARLLPKPELHKRYTSGKRVTYLALRAAD